MYPDMRHEQVVYQNPFLAMRIWQIDSEYVPTEDFLRKKQRELQQKKYLDWHYHVEVEFLLILKGELTAFCGEEQHVLRKGDIALFGSSEPHVTVQTTDGSLSYIVFQIDLRKYWDVSTLNSMQHFSEVIRPLSSLNYVYSDNRDARLQTASLIREIYREMNDGHIGYELAVSSRIKNILLLLLRNDTRQLLHYNDNRLLGRLQPAVDYVEANLSEKLAVSDICAKVNMSYTHFIKTFKKAVGMSFTDFVVYKRIKKAEQQLLTNDVSIAEVAESVGISNLGHFYDMFRRYNDCSPKQFKDRLREPIAEA
ncbi:AraC family transcriptional regulator [Cohnella lupini]|uniref:AraC-like DNA-binding protein n=1 Tax=Cohnella lupini TaxID=1294267 RepID=A0A3D9ISX1_9BACL|nr:AraC family transcriptional regulator [Cohnella lupini]RED64862.1 AraC-like DNA-binding protein [Cohnella lupini]